MSDVVEMAELVAGVVGEPSDDVDVKHGEEPGSKARRFESEESIDLDYGEDSENGEISEDGEEGQLSEDDDENSGKKSVGVESKNGNSVEKEEGELEDGELEDDSDGEVKSDERPSQDRIPITSRISRPYNPAPAKVAPPVVKRGDDHLSQWEKNIKQVRERMKIASETRKNPEFERKKLMAAPSQERNFGAKADEISSEGEPNSSSRVISSPPLAPEERKRISYDSPPLSPSNSRSRREIPSLLELRTSPPRPKDLGPQVSYPNGRPGRAPERERKRLDSRGGNGAGGGGTDVRGKERMRLPPAPSRDLPPIKRSSPSPSRSYSRTSSSSSSSSRSQSKSRSSSRTPPVYFRAKTPEDKLCEFSPTRWAVPISPEPIDSRSPSPKRSRKKKTSPKASSSKKTSSKRRYSSSSERSLSRRRTPSPPRGDIADYRIPKRHQESGRRSPRSDRNRPMFPTRNRKSESTEFRSRNEGERRFSGTSPTRKRRNSKSRERKTAGGAKFQRNASPKIDTISSDEHEESKSRSRSSASSKSSKSSSRSRSRTRSSSESSYSSSSASSKRSSSPILPAKYRTTVPAEPIADEISSDEENSHHSPERKRRKSKTPPSKRRSDEKQQQQQQQRVSSDSGKSKKIEDRKRATTPPPPSSPVNVSSIVETRKRPAPIPSPPPQPVFEKPEKSAKRAKKKEEVAARSEDEGMEVDPCDVPPPQPPAFDENLENPPIKITLPRPPALSPSAPLGDNEEQQPSTSHEPNEDEKDSKKAKAEKEALKQKLRAQLQKLEQKLQKKTKAGKVKREEAEVH